MGAGNVAMGDPFRANRALILHGDQSPLIDSSPNPKTITAVGNATYTTAQKKFGSGCIELDGSNSWLSIPAITLSGAFTLETHVRWKSLKSFGLIAVGSGPGTQLFLGLKANGTGLRWGLTGVAEHGTAAFTWALNTWYHVALVRNASNGFQCFVDRVNVTEGSPNNATAYSGTFLAGGSGGISAEPNAFFDEYIITTGVALTPAQFAFDAPVPDF